MIRLDFEKFQAMVWRHLGQVMEDGGAVLEKWEDCEGYLSLRFKTATTAIDIMLEWWSGRFYIVLWKLIDGRRPILEIDVDLSVHPGPFNNTVARIAESHGEPATPAFEMPPDLAALEEGLQAHAVWMTRHCMPILRGDFSKLEASVRWLNDQKRKRY